MLPRQLGGDVEPGQTVASISRNRVDVVIRRVARDPEIESDPQALPIPNASMSGSGAMSPAKDGSVVGLFESETDSLGRPELRKQFLTIMLN